MQRDKDKEWHTSEADSVFSQMYQTPLTDGTIIEHSFWLLEF